MRPIVSMTLAACAVIAIASPILAQTPPPATPPAPPAAGGTPDVMPFDIPYGVSIGLDKAKQVMAAAENEAKRRNWKMNIAVVDTNGELVHFSRMEGAQIASVPISIGKARTAARFRRESRAFYNAFETGHGYVSTPSIRRWWPAPAASRSSRPASWLAPSAAAAAPATRTP